MTEYMFDADELTDLEISRETELEEVAEEAEHPEETEAVESAEEPADDGRLTPMRVLEAIETMNAQDYVFKQSVMDKLLSIHSDGPSDMAPQAKAQAIERIAAGHEETVRQRLGVLREMYNDVKNRY